VVVGEWMNAQPVSPISAGARGLCPLAPTRRYWLNEMTFSAECNVCVCIRVQYYVNDTLMYKGDCHNIYVRIKVMKVAETGYYKVIIGGYGIDMIDVTHMSKQPEKLFHLGRTIALNTGLNFFDFDNVSTRHTIRHRCSHADDAQM